LKCREAKTEDGLIDVKDDVSSCEAKQQCLQGVDEEAVTLETTSSADMETGTNDDADNSDDESDEVEDGELISSSSSESELEPDEPVQEKGKRLRSLSRSAFV